ncbi:MAG: 30S ribosomal protein S17 [Planctomycetaceae bacterium]|jgi:small subunit ribosomal protein S17
MRRRVIGVVTRDQNLKTRRVEVERSYRHPKYGKILRTRTVCYAHDEENVSKKGDLVEIVECRPMSRLKRWSLVKVVKANTMPQVKVEAAVNS